MGCKTVAGELLAIGSCVKDGDVVVIKATVTDTRHGKLTTLVAHNEFCKTAKRKG